MLGQTTTPQLGTTWFSSTYWRMAGIAALLTLPFLFAAAVQALIRSDLALLARAALGYLPLAMLAVSVAAPLTMLLLAASDQMSAIVSSAAGNAGSRASWPRPALLVGVADALVSHSPFLAFLVGLLTVAGALVLWIELLMREAAVYVIVLMLPLAFAALVWPARRVWAIRAVELLVALILSKFAIVAVLSLGGAALGQRRPAASRAAGRARAGGARQRSRPGRCCACSRWPSWPAGRGQLRSRLDGRAGHGMPPTRRADRRRLGGVGHCGHAPPGGARLAVECRGSDRRERHERAETAELTPTGAGGDAEPEPTSAPRPPGGAGGAEPAAAGRGGRGGDAGGADPSATAHRRPTATRPGPRWRRRLTAELAAIVAVPDQVAATDHAALATNRRRGGRPRRPRASRTTPEPTRASSPDDGRL